MRTDSDDFYKAQTALIRTQSIERMTPAKLTPQVQLFVAGLVSGMSPVLAGEKAGMPEDKAMRLAQSDPVKEAVAHHRRSFAKQLSFGVAEAHHMYMQAFRAAGTSGEMTKATDSLVKLHRLLDPAVHSPEAAGQTVNARNIEHLSREQLLRLAQIGMDTLVPQAEAPRATVVDDDDDEDDEDD